MFQDTARPTRSDPEVGPEPWIVLVGVILALVLALPALVLGIVLARLTRGKRWAVPLWLGLAIPGLGLFALFIWHGFEPLFIAQLAEVVRDARLHQADLLQWDRARLWSETWPVWLRTGVLAPVIAAWRLLSAHMHSVGATSLRAQEQNRQQAVARAQRTATRRLRRLRRLPDAVHGQLFIGISIEDDANA